MVNTKVHIKRSFEIKKVHAFELYSSIKNILIVFYFDVVIHHKYII